MGGEFADICQAEGGEVGFLFVGADEAAFPHRALAVPLTAQVAKLPCLGVATRQLGVDDRSRPCAGIRSRRQPLERYGNGTQAEEGAQGHECLQKWQLGGVLKLPRFPGLDTPPFTDSHADRPPSKLRKVWGFSSWV